MNYPVKMPSSACHIHEKQKKENLVIEKFP